MTPKYLDHKRRGFATLAAVEGARARQPLSAEDVRLIRKAGEDQAEQRRVQARRDRYAALAVLRDESSLKRVRRCGIGTNARAGNVQVMVSHTPAGVRAGLSGVESCGSTWACPVCAEKIQAVRRLEVDVAMSRALSQGYSIGFVTLTVRHRAAYALRSVWGAVSTAWRATTSGSRAWSAEREALGIAGYLRLVEVTHGQNGWHVHVHALVFYRPGVVGGSLADQRAYADRRAAMVVEHGQAMAERWRSSLGPTVYRPTKANGGDVRVVTRASGLPDYFAKWGYQAKGVGSAAHDVTSSHGKQARHGNVTPFGILARLVADGQESDLDLWREWEAESKGKRQLLWSNGLRALLQQADEATDQEIVDQDHGGAPGLHVDPSAFRRLVQSRGVPALLEAAESGRLEAVTRLLGSGDLWWVGVGWVEAHPVEALA